MKVYRVTIERTQYWSIEVDATDVTAAKHHAMSMAFAGVPPIREHNDVRAVVDAELPTVEDVQEAYRQIREQPAAK